ncbi:Nas2 protein [Saccharomycopsis crataegensis]|uniref:Nas2 protein n=1 Tax=Saccharomycopsis crataegensis TaxID=43959 RepID=A0AAV5QSB8_9ASCO|nr:Nas2 protein [Saccharomycopsis crataegensis]
MTKQSQVTPSFDHGTALPPNYRIDNLSSMSFKDLSDLKTAVQNELFRLGALLKDQNVTMDTSILTADGYPRGDIDIVAIRHLRNRIIMLRNDFDKIIDQLDKTMTQQFQNNDDTNGSVSLHGLKIADNNNNKETLQPFMVIQDILPQSPVFQGSFQVDDKIVEFDTLTYENTSHLTGQKNAKLFEVARLVKAKQNQSLGVTVLRYDPTIKDYKLLELKLIPHSNWNGLGLLGCKLVQI